MALTTGTKLGPYEIQSPLGSGGMGEVYRARDLRLERIVAIKILASTVSNDPSVQQRFEREARTISALSHPNICHLYDIGAQDGTSYLVMELLDGESLAQRVRKSPLPIPALLMIGIQVAEALEVAHRAGITHRDLKPANIMLTKSGAKLMDFGLAKARPLANSTASSAGSVSPSMPTINVSGLTAPADALTKQGSIVGTFQYMAPEVLQGAEADARSDIFSFGCVLYEMATGKRAFDGKSQVGVLAAILEKDPEPISTVQPLAPATLDRLIRICLAKDPDLRWQSAHDLKIQLQAMAELGSQAGVPAVVVASRKQQKRTLLSLAVVGWLLALLAGVGLFNLSRSLSAHDKPLHAELSLPPAISYSLIPGTPEFSPDGSRLVFVGNSIVEAQEAALASRSDGGLWIRDLRNGIQSRLTSTETAKFPFWSPDGRSVGFFSDGKLRTIPAGGGPVQIICDAPEGRGGTWTPDGFILFTPNTEEPIYKVPESGGKPVAVTKLGTDGFTNRNPFMLPDGKHFLFTRRKVGATVGDLYIGSTDGSEPVMAAERASKGEYSSGYIFFVRDRNLMAQRFDLASLATRGNPVPMVENVEFYNPRDLGDFAVSQEGSLIYRPTSFSQSRFAWMRFPSKEIEEFGDPFAVWTGQSGALSRDGKKVAFSKMNESSPDSDLWVLDTTRNTLTKAMARNTGAVSFAFSPDGDKIVTAIVGKADVIIHSLTNGTDQKITASRDGYATVDEWSPDGNYLMLNLQDPKTSFDIYAFPVDGSKPLPLLTQSYDEAGGRVSPNGKWMAYSSNESGRNELYVTNFPAVSSKIQVSTEGVFWYTWGRDGKKLYFSHGDGLFSAEMPSPDKLEFGKVANIGTLNGASPIDFAPDGRLLIVKSRTESALEPFRLILNVPAALRQ